MTTYNGFTKNELLSNAISTRLEYLWNQCDKYGMGSKEYEQSTDEASALHIFVRENQITLPEYIASRF